VRQAAGPPLRGRGAKNVQCCRGRGLTSPLPCVEQLVQPSQLTSIGLGWGIIGSPGFPGVSAILHRKRMSFETGYFWWRAEAKDAWLRWVSHALNGISPATGQIQEERVLCNVGRSSTYESVTNGASGRPETGESQRVKVSGTHEEIVRFHQPQTGGKTQKIAMVPMRLAEESADLAAAVWEFLHMWPFAWSSLVPVSGGRRLNSNCRCLSSTAYHRWLESCQSVWGCWPFCNPGHNN